jgi:uncharacterized protein involved in exopolysaccharide biosynthesis
MTQSTERQDVSILDLISALVSGWRIIVVGTLIVSVTTGALSLLLEDEYESVVQLLPPKEAKKGFGFAELLSALPIPSLRLGEKGTPADIFVAILKSPTMRRKMVDRFDLTKVYETEGIEDALEALERRTEIGKSEEGTIMISVTDRDPQQATDMANQYVMYLDTTNQLLSNESAQERFEFISLLEEREDVKLQDAMQQLQIFQEEHNAISLADQARATIRTAAEMQMAAMELVIKRLSLMQSGFGESHPDVRRLQKEAQNRQLALRYLRDGDASVVDPVGDSHISQVFGSENLFLPLRDIPSVSQEYANIEKDVLVQGALMKMLLEQKAESLIEASNTTSTIQVLDHAMVPEKPAGPRRLLMVLIAATLSLFASIFYVLAATYVSALRARWRVEYSQHVASR